MSKPHVFLTMPRSGPGVRNFESTPAFWFATGKPTAEVAVTHDSTPTSSLPYTFGEAWCRCLNGRVTQGYTHFGMIHDDVCPEGKYWLDTFLEHMDIVGADVLSAVIPIKDPRGLSTTALDELGDPWLVRRLTLAECFERPVTFTDPKLLLNVGLMLVKLGPWCEQTWFQQIHKPGRLPDGTLTTLMMSEDWDWSRQARQNGAKLYATRAVPLWHEQRQWHNRSPWGWETDQVFSEALRLKKSQQAVERNGECVPPASSRAELNSVFSTW